MNNPTHFWLQYRRQVSPSLKDLLHNILKFNPKERLSLMEISCHPWVVTQAEAFMP
jgi:serine/threonine protein kinase